MLGDRRFLAFSILSAAISIHNHLLPFALPLWLAVKQPKLTWISGVVLVINTLLCVALQVKASAQIYSARLGGLSFFVGGVAIACSYLLLANFSSDSATTTIIFALVFVVVYSTGEVLQAAGSIELIYRLAPAERQGQYSATYGVCQGLASAIAPVFLGIVISARHLWGWLAIASATAMLSCGVVMVTWGLKEAEERSSIV